MDELSRSWLRRHAREQRDDALAVAHAFAGKIDKMPDPEKIGREGEQGDGLSSEGWENHQWWDSSEETEEDIGADEHPYAPS